MPGPNQQAGGLAIGRLPFSLDTWLEGSSTSSDLISDVGSIKDSEIMELYFVYNSDTVGDGTVQVVDVLVLQGPVGVTSAILVMEQALTMNTIFPVPQCASVNVRACAASGHHCQCATSWPECKCSHTNACSGHCFTSRNSSTNHNVGPAFPPVASVPYVISGSYAANGRCAVAQSELALS